jgi:quercetin dioxygenase-like cupin family protein
VLLVFNRPFPELITRLPQADVPIPDVKAYLSQGPDHQIVFFEIEPTAKIPPHSHGPQWGVLVEGEMSLTIGDRTERLKPGDSYFIPDGVTHSAIFHRFCRVIDIFADKDRYQPK